MTTPGSVTRQDKTIAEWVAIIVALGISLSLLTATGGAVAVALMEHRSLGENAAQVLTGWGGGIVGILGAYVGYAFGHQTGRNGSESHAELQTEAPKGECACQGGAGKHEPPTAGIVSKANDLETQKKTGPGEPEPV